MKFFFDIGNRYLQKSDWKDLALVKFCLFSMGIVVGVLLPPKEQKKAVGIASVVFLATYIPLMTKLYHIMKE